MMITTTGQRAKEEIEIYTYILISIVCVFLIGRQSKSRSCKKVNFQIAGVAASLLIVYRSRSRVLCG